MIGEPDFRGRGYGLRLVETFVRYAFADFGFPVKILEVSQEALDRGKVSARGLDRALRVAWSIADLRGDPSPTAADVLEALVLRNGGAE